MSNFFYPRLAITNIRKNSSIYLPYLLAAVLVTALFYVLRSVTVMVAMSGMRGGSSVGMILLLSTWLCGFFAILILFYVNSFVMKRRKREFGLYSVLGMGRSHIFLVMAWEVFFTGGLGIVAGILSGALLSQLMFLVLLKIVGLPPALTFSIPTQAVLSTILLFAAGFGLVLLYDILCIRRVDPIALLHSQKQGEKEPRSRWLLAVLGTATLGSGYALALTVRRPSDAVGVFFPAVLLVIIGTYCLFTAGSIVLLKLLRKRKRFYYRPNNFISVSGMIYRMKQNAAGLASICILSTAVLVTLSSTVCLFIGEEDILRLAFPRQAVTSALMREEDPSADVPALMQAAVEKHAAGRGLRVENSLGYHDLSLLSRLRDGSFTLEGGESGEYWWLEFITLEDYNQGTGQQLTLAPGEVLAAGSQRPSEENRLRLEGREYRVAQWIDYPKFLGSANPTLGVLVVLPSAAELDSVAALCREKDPDRSHPIQYKYLFDVAGESAVVSDFYATLRDAMVETVPGLSSVRNIDDARQEFYQLYGGLLFVGIFFVSLFLIATVLIIYYKQITEGYDDHDRFQIMEKVGMSDREVRRTIQKQILLVFFLPLGTAVLHITVAIPVLSKLLTVLGMSNTPLFFLCALVTVLVFALFYLAIYQLTARTYYKIVQSRG